MTTPAQSSVVRISSLTKVLRNRPLRDGASATSRFGDTVWDMSPGVFEGHYRRLTLAFDQCPVPFRHMAKTYVWTLINTDDPVPLRRTSGAQRLSLRSITQSAYLLFVFLQFLDSRGIYDVREVTPSLYDDFLEAIKTPEMSYNKRGDLVSEVRRFWSYRSQLPESYRLPERNPWDYDAVQHSVGGAAYGSSENKTPRISEEVMTPLLMWALRYVEDFSDEIIAASGEYTQLFLHLARDYGTTRTKNCELWREVEEWVAEAHEHGYCVPGKLDGSGQIVISWRHVMRLFNTRTVMVPGRAVRGILERSGLPLEVGLRLRTPNTSQLDGKPWNEARILYEEAADHARDLSAACFIVIAYLSGMRPGEVLNLRRGCGEYDPKTGLHLVRGLTWKSICDNDGNKIPQGAERADPWVVVEPVTRAIGVLERLHSAEFLFPAHLDQTRRVVQPAITSMNPALRTFIEHVNQYCKDTGRSDFIPEDRNGQLIMARQFRRTLAWHICRRPRGLVAGAIQYGHVKTQMFLGYSGNYESGFRDEAGMEDFLMRLERLEVDTAALDAGENVSGPASQEYQRRTRDGAAHFAGRVVRTNQQTRALLRNPLLQVFPGEGMTCVFDPNKALCQFANDAEAQSNPSLDDCKARCRNIARTDRDISVVREQIEKLRPRLDDPLSPTIRLAREREHLAHLEQIVAEHEGNNLDADA